ncbi:hypothetical protein WN48_07818 [Eufriesea mexicana]|uniref:Uncharacterized protein n=1 Tax=Eufriesea mexicana TaxID=516756 RepID=A0A310SBK7_9HYME|nr:hypothetical protein WN48_07818 [Eufriesea mexicana]
MVESHLRIRGIIRKSFINFEFANSDEFKSSHCTGDLNTYIELDTDELHCNHK